MSTIDVFTLSPGAFIACALVLGLLVGSFINVLAWRLPKMLEQDWQAQARELLGLPAPAKGPVYNLMLPRSHCPHCQHTLRAWENIPLLSYLVLRGKCSQCKTAISLRYPLTELTCAVLSGVVAWHFGASPQAGWMLLLTWGLLGICLIDLKHQIVPDVLVLPLMWLGLLLNTFETFTSLIQAVWGAALGYLSLWSIFWLFKLLTGKDGMGYGDFKLLALFGAWGGMAIVPLTIVLSSLLGALVGLALLAMRRAQASTPIPFAPYLAIAGWIALLWGGQMADFYWQISV
ncbi:prepilin peptidase [Pseudomonas sp. FSL R10-0399]|uniref:prepilin peptidase n=1 Tax=Pseudomonas sp. FSL R10-0399 TaxID=2662194 RepID=UPI0012966360|nr:A24 family peptidase [Pseudomonas sp. FSL R10-0399]MQT58725.1 prepilin peptidase [Pseudomonas sp. FSL R10-0399]